eukprot:766801-Hanusia_phi.AAC.1
MPFATVFNKYLSCTPRRQAQRPRLPKFIRPSGACTTGWRFLELPTLDRHRTIRSCGPCRVRGKCLQCVSPRLMPATLNVCPAPDSLVDGPMIAKARLDWELDPPKLSSKISSDDSDQRDCQDLESASMRFATRIKFSQPFATVTAS